MRRRAAALVAGLVCAAALWLPTAAAHATGDPQDAPAPSASPPVADGVPDEVAAWYRTEGLEVLQSQASVQLGLTAGDTPELGLVRPVWTWSPDFLDGVSLARPVVETEEWVAPVRVESSGVGVLVAGRERDRTVRLEGLHPRGELADRMYTLAVAEPLVHDPVLDAWFAIVDDEVRPVDDAARESLAGSLPLEDYQPFVAERYADPVPDPGVPSHPSWVPAAWIAGGVAVLLAWAGLVVWIRHEAG